MIERGQDRRQTVAWFSSIPSEHRREGYDRRGRVVPTFQGAVRPGFAEAAPREERRRVPETGVE